MLNAVCFLPATPLLHPRLGGAAADETRALRRAVIGAVGSVTGPETSWTVLGVGPVDQPVTDELSGWAGFGAYGVDAPVWLGPGTTPDDRNVRGDRSVALPGLIAGWLREELGATAAVEQVLVPADLSPTECAELGGTLDERFAEEQGRRIVLVVADGPNTLTDRAPGAFHPDAAEFDELVAEAVATGDRVTLLGIDPERAAPTGLEGRAPWQVAAELATRRDERSMVQMVAGYGFHYAPYGVGYHVGVWRW